MQTPLMELIEWIKNGDDGLLWTQQDITEKATELLEKEKEVIMDAYWDGGQDMPTMASTVYDYFTKTFTGKND